ncbi:TPA: D-alanyl-D-alanine carboxypeptidase, partial [Streptococcus pyogenes]
SKTLSKKARQKLEKLVPQTKKETSPKQQHFKATKKQSYLERVEDFMNHNHTFLLICLAIFIITILLLSLVVFAMGRQ